MTTQREDESVKSGSVESGPAEHGFSRRTRLVARIAAGSSVCAAVLVIGVLHPAAKPAPPDTATVSAAVLNDLGQLKWVAATPTLPTSAEAEGRRLYVQSRCLFCHSQYAELSSDEQRRWGPPVEPGEYAADRPPLFGLRGIGPDLAREGLKYGDEWHLGHFYNPPLLTQGSIMGGFSGYFDQPATAVNIVDDAANVRTLERTPATEKLFNFSSKDQVKLTPNQQGLLFVPSSAKGKFPLVWTPNEEYSGTSVKLVVETKEIEALIAYVQKLGIDRGRWRDAAEPEEIEGSDLVLQRSPERIAHGKEVFERRCVACHGAEGNGNGEAATFTYRQRPRNFTTGVFKFRLVKGPVPTDRDLLRTITRGVRGTSMPAWYWLPLEDRLDVIQYVKYELAVDRSDPKKPYAYFVEEPPGEPIQIGAPPAPTAELLTRGHGIWQQAKCWECHGQGGRGDGEKAAGLKDDWGFPIRPANLTSGQFKSGPHVQDIFRTLTTGLSGSPMPAFKDAIPNADRWALAYYVRSLAAFTDPLTTAALPISDADRAALNDPATDAGGPQHAYRLTQVPALQTPVLQTSAAQAPVKAAEARPD